MPLLKIAAAVAAIIALAGFARDGKELRAFRRANPCPFAPEQGCIVDHVVPLCAGGLDHRSNMQWQTVSEAKVKDREEIRLCRSLKARKQTLAPLLH